MVYASYGEALLTGKVEEEAEDEHGGQGQQVVLPPEQSVPSINETAYVNSYIAIYLPGDVKQYIPDGKHRVKRVQ